MFIFYLSLLSLSSMVERYSSKVVILVQIQKRGSLKFTKASNSITVFLR